MSAIQINIALTGANVMGFLVASLFFFRFWRLTHERLFATFTLAFCVMALERVAFLVLGTNHEFTPYVYFLRLAAFALILVGIIDKNRSR
jgi:Family of unknown function (DUF5985)